MAPTTNRHSEKQDLNFYLFIRPATATRDILPQTTFQCKYFVAVAWMFDLEAGLHLTITLSIPLVCVLLHLGKIAKGNRFPSALSFPILCRDRPLGDDNTLPTLRLSRILLSSMRLQVSCCSLLFLFGLYSKTSSTSGAGSYLTHVSPSRYLPFTSTILPSRTCIRK